MNKLEHYRNRKGLTQHDLERLSGVDQADISRTEKGIKDLPGRKWLAIAQVLDCTVEELLGKTE